MLKKVLNIFSILLLPIFLIPATGFYYTHHACLRSGEVRLVLDRDYSCCEDRVKDQHNDPLVHPSCCQHGKSQPSHPGKAWAQDDPSQDCCMNTGNYLKTKDEYTFPGKFDFSQVIITFPVIHPFLELPSVVADATEENVHGPPLAPHGRDMLHKHAVLIV